MHRTRDLWVSALARVEGEGALHVVVEQDAVREASLRIFEPPRYFEQLLRGRQFSEAPDITSRICGICPIAYQTSAWQAMERLAGARVSEPIKALRRLLYCGEWISSHVLHIYLLHAPDFLGHPDAVSLASVHHDIVERGLQLKKVGNIIAEVVGGRAVHPVNARVGGFYRAPAPAEIAALAGPLERALDDAVATVRWVAGFDFPDLDLDHGLLALHDEARYAIEDGDVLRSDRGDFALADFGRHVVERQVPHSTALHATLDGRLYLTGPLARYTLNGAQLSPLARELAAAAGLGPSCRNPFRSIVVRAVETVYAVEEALRLVAAYEPPEPAAVEVAPRAGTGHGASEAPRGLLYHRYELDADGSIVAATIVPPTAQNQDAIEDALRRVVAANLALGDAELSGLCEQTIRNYDPCISCAAHFLDLTVERR